MLTVFIVLFSSSQLKEFSYDWKKRWKRGRCWCFCSLSQKEIPEALFIWPGSDCDQRCRRVTAGKDTWSASSSLSSPVSPIISYYYHFLLLLLVLQYVPPYSIYDLPLSAPMTVIPTQLSWKLKSPSTGVWCYILLLHLGDKRMAWMRYSAKCLPRRKERSCQSRPVFCVLHCSVNLLAFGSRWMLLKQESCLRHCTITR